MNLTANVNEGYLSSSEEHPTITYLTEEKNNRNIETPDNVQDESIVH